jgi:hypothetical protein
MRSENEKNERDSNEERQRERERARERERERERKARTRKQEGGSVAWWGFLVLSCLFLSIPQAGAVPNQPFVKILRVVGILAVCVLV